MILTYNIFVILVCFRFFPAIILNNSYCIDPMTLLLIRLLAASVHPTISIPPPALYPIITYFCPSPLRQGLAGIPGTRTLLLWCIVRVCSNIVQFVLEKVPPRGARVSRHVPQPHAIVMRLPRHLVPRLVRSRKRPDEARCPRDVAGYENVRVLLIVGVIHFIRYALCL